LKALKNDLKIPCLPETATDEEIEAAREALCQIQEEIRESQKKIKCHFKILYDKYDIQKREKFKSICKTNPLEDSNEKIFEENSKEIMKDLSIRKESLVCDHVLLAKVD
jgi:hypothetical protein